MEISILVEPVSGNGYRAASGDPWRLESHAPTRDAAIDDLRELILRRIARGAEVVTLNLGPTSHPLYRFYGLLKDEPLLEPWKQAMAEYRQDRDADELVP
jgi:hypothetical protein